MDYTVDAMCTKSLKRQPFRQVPVRCPNGELAKNELEQANAFGLHLEDLFTPFDFASTEQKGDTQHNLQTPLQMALPIKHIRIEEISEVIQLLPKNKAPGIDRICNTIHSIDFQCYFKGASVPKTMEISCDSDDPQTRKTRE